MIKTNQEMSNDQPLKSVNDVISVEIAEIFKIDKKEECIGHRNNQTNGYSMCISIPALTSAMNYAWNKTFSDASSTLIIEQYGFDDLLNIKLHISRKDFDKRRVN